MNGRFIHINAECPIVFYRHAAFSDSLGVDSITCSLFSSTLCMKVTLQAVAIQESQAKAVWIHEAPLKVHYGMTIVVMPVVCFPAMTMEWKPIELTTYQYRKALPFPPQCHGVRLPNIG